jgi:hypothetical protein
MERVEKLSVLFTLVNQYFLWNTISTPDDGAGEHLVAKRLMPEGKRR